MKKNSLTQFKEKYQNLMADNRFLKLLSVLLAITCWFLVVTMIDPSTYDTIRDVPVTVDLTDTIAQKSGLSLLDTEEQYIDVRVKGKTFYVGRLSADDFTATVNLTSVTSPGTYSLEVKVEAKESDGDFEIVSNEPQKLELSFDRLETKTFTLEAYVPNVTASDGYIIDQYTVSPAEITISGPEGTINQIAQCVVENTDRQTITSSVLLDGTLKLKDANGNELSQKYMNFSANSPAISVPLYRKVSLPLTFDFINVPAGVDVSKIGYVMEPADSVEVAIPVDAMASIESISLGEIDLRKVDIGKVITMDVSMLAGYLNLDDLSEVSVTFQSEGMDSKVLTCTNIVLKNVPAQYDVSILSERISDIKFVGTKEAIQSLQSSDVVATIDFASMGGVINTGEQRVEVSISLNDTLQAWAVGEKSVLISIADK